MALVVELSFLGEITPGQQHRDTLPVAAVFVAKHLDQIALFQEDADEDVGSGHRCEQQMSNRHRRRRPERDDEAEVDRVPHEFVVQRRPKTWRRRLDAAEVVGDLMQSEQLEVVDQEGAAQRRQPAPERYGRDRRRHFRLFDMP